MGIPVGIEVFKFGGVAVGSPEAIRAAVEHVRKAAPNVAVIVSAANGITDALLDTAQTALRGDRDAYLAAAQRFETRHYELIAGVISKRAHADELRKVVLDAANEMRSMAESIAVLRELTTRAQDALVARGERIMARIFVVVLREQGIDAEYVDAPDVIITERRLGSLWPNFHRCERAAKKHVLPLLAAGRVVIMPEPSMEIIDCRWIAVSALTGYAPGFTSSAMRVPLAPSRKVLRTKSGILRSSSGIMVRGCSTFAP